MAVPGPSLGLFPYYHWYQKKILPCTVNECNNINKSLHHFVGCSTDKAAAFTEGSQPKLKLIIPDYIKENPEDSISETIKNLCKEGKFQVALDIFYILKKRQDVSIDSEVYAVLLDGCYNMRAVEESRIVHRHMVESGIEVDSSLSAKLVAMYANRGKLLDARQVFEKMPERGLLTWNVIIGGYVKNGRSDEALRMFCEMTEEGVGMDNYTLGSVLRACASKCELGVGRQAHGCAIRMEFQKNIYVGSALLDMYSKCGRIEDARKVFDKLPKKNVVSWNAMIAGYAQHGCEVETLRLFGEMQFAGVKADHFTLPIILRACSRLALLGQAKQVHGVVVRYELELDLVLGGALVNLYSKWGRVEDARQVFEKMPEKSIISWNAMIAGYGSHGQGKEAILLFEQMQREGYQPNHVSLSTILSACSYSGLVDEGWQYFDSMRQDYGISPRARHYACMVEIIGRSGNLDDAYHFIRKIPIRHNTYAWGALLGACRIHVNVKLGEVAAEHLFKLEPNKIGNYLAMLDIYVAAGKKEHAASLRKMMEDRELIQGSECSWIEVKGCVHMFITGDRLHPLREEIYALLKKLTTQLTEPGYEPIPGFMLPHIEQQQEEFLCYHSEKLAIAFVLIKFHHFTTFQVSQNHRICADCHTTIKFISKIVDREIVVRDPKCFHHFKGGLCSCGDYW